MDVAVGGEFLLGTFSFLNGEWWAASPIHDFTMEMVTHSSDGALNGHVFSDTLILNITFNGGPPENKADFFYFAGRPDLGSMRVYENQDGLSNYGTVELYGKIGSLIPTRFANPTGGVFLDPSIDASRFEDSDQNWKLAFAPNLLEVDDLVITDLADNDSSELHLY